MSVLHPSAYEEPTANSQPHDLCGNLGLVLITIVTPATATPSVIHGTSVNLSVPGEDVLGESLLRYTWAMTSGPAEANVQFTENGSNRAKNSTAIFSVPGRYTFSCTLTNGLFGVVSSVDVLVEEITSLLAA